MCPHCFFLAIFPKVGCERLTDAERFDIFTYKYAAKKTPPEHPMLRPSPLLRLNRHDSGTYWCYMLSCNQTFIALLYLQDQEDRGGLHRPENTTETKYQSLRTCSNKQKWQEGGRGEKHSIKLYKRNDIRKQVATDDLEQLERSEQQWRRQVVQKGETKNQIIILLYFPIRHTYYVLIHNIYKSTTL